MKLKTLFTRKSAKQASSARDVLAEELAKKDARRRNVYEPREGDEHALVPNAELLLSGHGNALGFPEQTALDEGVGSAVREGLDPKLLGLLTPKLAHMLRALPVRATSDSVVVAVDAKPTTERRLRLEWIINSARERKWTLRYTIVESEFLTQCLDRYYPWRSAAQQLDPDNDTVAYFLQCASQSNERVLRVTDGPYSISKLFYNLLLKAATRGAADMFVEPGAREVQIRYKVEGVCEPACSALPPSMGPRLARVIKGWAGLNTAEDKTTQDGDFTTKVKLRDETLEIKCRVNVTPCVHGEDITIRLHENSARRKTLDSLHADPRTLDALWDVVRMRRGFVLLCGPTGSGKTTTLAAILSECDAKRERIVTIENPPEILIPGVQQTEINVAKGVTFASLSRSFVRRAPDRLLFGEIRDDETAANAVQIATSGHQVLSTIHCEYASQVVARLANFKVHPFNIAHALTVVVSQRLLNLLCEHCAVEVEYDRDTLLGAQFLEEELPYIRTREAAGCAMCHGKGTLGRKGIYETIVIDNDLKAIINKHDAEFETRFEAAAARKGMRPLRRSGLDLVKQGRVSLSLVLSVCRDMPPMVFEAVRPWVGAEDIGFNPVRTGEWAWLRRPDAQEAITAPAAPAAPAPPALSPWSPEGDDTQPDPASALVAGHPCDVSADEVARPYWVTPVDDADQDDAPRGHGLGSPFSDPSEVQTWGAGHSVEAQPEVEGQPPASPACGAGHSVEAQPEGGFGRTLATHETARTGTEAWRADRGWGVDQAPNPQEHPRPAGVSLNIDPILAGIAGLHSESQSGMGARAGMAGPPEPGARPASALARRLKL